MRQRRRGSSVVNVSEFYKFPYAHKRSRLDMSVREMVPGVVAKFREDLTGLVETYTSEPTSPARFAQMVEALKSILAAAGRSAFAELVGAHEEDGDLMEHGGKRHRFKQVSRKEWLTPFGLVEVDRRYFQPDAGGDGLVPIDLRCGMSGRYMTPDMEEATALASADLSPSATRHLFGKVLPQAPSDKAIRRVIDDVGCAADEMWEQVENRVADEAPLPEGEDDVLVVSVDGVNVPMREAGVKTGRPAERPGVRESARTPTVWREAGVATISIYQPGDGNDVKPKRLATRYFARMPEAGMTTLFAEQNGAVWRLVQERRFRDFVVICDGKPALWKTFEGNPLYARATKILDFFHVAEHLSKAAEAIFGKKEGKATRWYAKYKALLLEDEGGLESLLRSLRYYRKGLRAGTERRVVIDRVVRYFGRNRERMRYAEFRARGLPIGSGVVEAACKSIVNARLKRSGMRWSQEGGQHVLNLRTRARSGEWAPFWSAYMEPRKVA